MSDDLKHETQKHLLSSLETSNVQDLDCVIRYLLRTVSCDDVDHVLSEMRAKIPFKTLYNHAIFMSFKQCVPIHKFLGYSILNIVSNCNNSYNSFYPIDLWLLFILYDKTNYPKS